MISELTKQLRRDEGEVLYAYADSLSYLTIGIGRMIDRRKGGGITSDEAAYLLANDITRHDAELTQRAPWVAALDDVRRGALVNMAFQLGVDGLLKFEHTLALIQQGDYGKASEAMMQSAWAEQTPARAQRLAIQIISGVWQ